MVFQKITVFSCGLVTVRFFWAHCTTHMLETCCWPRNYRNYRHELWI